MSNTIDNIRFNFLYIDTYSFGSTWVYPESFVPYNMLRYIISGEGTFFIDRAVGGAKETTCFLLTGKRRRW